MVLGVVEGEGVVLQMGKGIDQAAPDKVEFPHVPAQ